MNTSRGLRRFTLLAALAVAIAQAGCMSTGPIAGCFNPKADYASVVPGATKAQVDEALAEVGMPIGDGRAVVYRYEHTDAWRGRRWVYAWVDFVTLFAAEVIFAPVERLAVYMPAQRTALAVFDESGGLVAFRQMHDDSRFRVGGEAAPAHTNPGPYSQAWEWSTFWGRGRTDCKRGHES